MGQIAHLLIFPIPNGLSMEGTENEILKEDNNVLSIWHFEASRRGMENQSCRPIEAFRAIFKTPTRKRTRGNAENVSIAARDAKRAESVARPGAQNGVSPWKKSRSARPRANSRFANLTKRFYRSSALSKAAPGPRGPIAPN